MHSRPLILFFGLCLCASVACGQSISSFTPAYGQPNVDIITIEGSGFTGVTNVTFYPNKTAPAGSWQVTADTQINAYIPVGATNGPITVIKAGNRVSSVDDLIVIGPGPYITDLSATNGAVGTTIQINGVHFTGATSVKFNGTGTSGTITTDQQITATIPANATSGFITVTGPNGTGTSPVPFYYPPGVQSFSPSAGRPGTNVVIKGTNFLNATKVLFGSLNATFVTNSLTQITAVVPPNAVSGPVRVVAPGGQYITTTNFIAQPDISSLSPIAGNVNTVVTISGANLNVGSPTYPVVRFNGVVATLLSVTASQVQVYAPSGTSSGPVTVQTSEGTATSPTNFFYPPNITALNPTNGGPGQTVTITGQNFTNASSVVFNTANATNFTVVNNSTVTAVVPIDATTGQIFVTTPGGTAPSAQRFFVTPIITGFSPQTGVVGVTVTITGTNFSFFKSLQFNGVTATVATNTGDNLITANVPNGATTGPITVFTPGNSVTTTNNFTVVPLLLSISNLDSSTVAVSWTTNAPGFQLQSTTNPQITTNSWSNEPVAAQIIGGKMTVTNATTNAQKYYRLRK